MIRRYLAAVLAAFIVPVGSRAQGPETFRTIASFTDERIGDPHVSPDGRLILIGSRSQLRVLDVATQRTSKIADGGGWDFAWSATMDRIAWVRGDADGKGQYVWTMPVDPKTGASRGPAQRVTMGLSDYPAISPDGKWIAFQAPDSASIGRTGGLAPHHVSIVPVTGGPERLLASFDEKLEGEHWSADSKSLFVPGSPRGRPHATLSRIYVDGRAPEIIRGDTHEWVTGMTADHKHIVVVPARSPVSAGDSAIVLDTAGREIGRAPLPVGTTAQYDAPIDSALVWVWSKTRRSIEIAHKGSAPKRVSVGEASESPMWSPDGKLIAFQVRENGHNVLALMNPDGSGIQLVRDAIVRPDQWGARWSPDSRAIGYVSADWHEFRVLDVASRTSRVVLKDPTRRFGNWTWRPDSKSIATTMIAQQSPPKGSIDEVTLAGAHRSLFDFGEPPMVPTSGFQFIDGSTVFLRADSAAYVIRLDGGSARRLTSVPPRTRAFGTAVSADRRIIVSPMLDEVRGQLDQIEVLSVETGERRLLRVPFRIVIVFQPVFVDNDRALLVFGQRDGDSGNARLFSVPLNGDPPRDVADVGNVGNGSASASPDGTSTAYTVLAERTTTMLLVDLRGILSGKPSRSTKRDQDR